MRILGKHLEKIITDEPGGKIKLTNVNLDRAISYPLYGRRPRAKITSRTVYNPYKLSLFIIDLFISFLAFYVITNTYDKTDYGAGNYTLYFNLAIFSLITIFFFKIFHLYNYHRIFNPKTHIKLIIKSTSWSLASVFLIIGVYHYPDFFRGSYSIGIIFLFAIAFMLLSRRFSDQLLNIIIVLGITFISLGILGIINYYEEGVALLENPKVILGSFILAICSIVVFRFIVVHIAFNKWLKEHFRRQVIIIGSNDHTKGIIEYVVNKNAPFWIAGFIAPDRKSDLDLSVCKDRLCDLNELPGIVNEHKVNEIIITDKNLDKQTLISILDYCTSERINAWFLPDLMPIIDIKLNIDDFCGIPMIQLCSQKNSWIFNKIKHGLDALVCLPVMICLFPIFFIIGFLIKRNSPGPVFYRARAIGRDGKEFSMYKFRSMRVDTDNSIHKDFVTKLIKGEIRKEDKKDGVLKITDDPRITSVGNILRKTSIDELPQILNVLKGEMSLVGPRPCLPYEFEIYKDWHKKRLSIRPGITCLWQVAGRSDVDFEDMVLLDLYYIYNRNLLMDLNIIYETIFVVLAKKGAH